MTFLTPGLALLTAGIGVPVIILLHVLRLRRLPQRVPTTLLWRRSVEDLEANTPFQRLRPSLLFMLQLLAVSAAALAAGTPMWSSNDAPGTLVVVLDARARMQAMTDRAPLTPDRDESSASEPARGSTPRSAAPRTRFDLARARAGEVIRNRSGPDTEVHLVVARANPALIMSGGVRAALDALDRLTATDEPGSARDAMELAAQLAGDGEIVWVGDPTLARSDNVGISVLSAQRSVSEPGTVEVLVAVVNSGRESVELPLVVSLDDATMAARRVRVPAAPDDSAEEPGRATLLLKVPFRPGALLTARLETSDALPTDDRASLRISPAAPIRVAFMAPESDAPASPLRALLAVMDEVQPVSLPCTAPLASLAGFDLAVADGCDPPALQSDSAEIPWLIFASPAPGAAPLDRAAQGSIPGAARAHPVTQGVPPFLVDVAPVSSPVSAPVSAPASSRAPTPAPPPASTPSSTPAPTGPGEPPARAVSLPAGAIPLLADGDRLLAFIDPRGPGVRFLFPLRASDWPADPSWVMLMQNALLWLVGDDGESAGVALRTGVPARVLVEGRDGQRAWAAAPAMSRIGTITLRSPDGAETEHPVSLLDEAQSDLRARAAPTDPRGFEERASLARDRTRDGDRIADRDDTAARPLWPWFAMAALVLLLTEWSAYFAAINRSRRVA